MNNNFCGLVFNVVFKLRCFTSLHRFKALIIIFLIPFNRTIHMNDLHLYLSNFLSADADFFFGHVLYFDNFSFSFFSRFQFYQFFILLVPSPLGYFLFLHHYHVKSYFAAPLAANIEGLSLFFYSLNVISMLFVHYSCTASFLLIFPLPLPLSSLFDLCLYIFGLFLLYSKRHYSYYYLYNVKMSYWQV